MITSFTQPNLIVSSPGIGGAGYALHVCGGPYRCNHLGRDEVDHLVQ